LLTPAHKFITENYRKSGVSCLAQHWEPIYPQLFVIEEIRKNLVDVESQKSNYHALDNLKDLYWQ
jgi:hypothetical protein